ncbi:TlpA family protein disulfide reductase [Aquihabitans sp. McL0605]|uniref:TlpA family protein disulfide reductase n=1 Tax=Aquihabitans sp. McL0605 TaxID=3415671 RepID=UPI003CF964D6
MTSPEKSRNGSVIWIGVLAVVLILGLVAIIASRGGSSDGDDTATGGGASTTTVSVPTSVDPGSAPVLPAYDANADPDPAVGQTIPTATGKTFDGDDITIGPNGKAQIILFVAHWCPHCQREIPLLKAHLDDHPMPDDVALTTVSTSVHPGADNYPPQEWLEREGWKAPVLDDGEDSLVANDFGLTSFPYFVAVDAQGKVVMRASGELTTDQFDAAVKAAQTGQA